MRSKSQSEFFKEITGFCPYPFQVSFFQTFFANKDNLIVTAPTGSGKTWLATFPFIYGKLLGQPFADRMFYVLPQRTLVTAVADTIRPNLEQFDLNVTVQMGGQGEDPLFEGDIIVTTIDQLLSTYIGISYGSTRSSSNIAPGSLLGSYLVIDEFHLLETDKSLSTLIDLVFRLQPFVRFLMMTATAPQPLVSEIAKRTKSKCYRISSEEVTRLQQKANTLRERAITWIDTSVTAETVLSFHRDKTLVVVNTVEKVQNLFLELKRIAKGKEGLNIVCLHARFLPEDRTRKQKQIKLWLGKESIDETIVIGNQVVEVGLDVSATVLITELCPASSLIQRIGRCARYGETVGNVYVCDVDVNKRGTKSYLPYEKELVLQTRNYLEEHSPFRVTAVEEEKMVNFVHNRREQEDLLEVSVRKRREEVEQSIRTGQVAYLRSLIREVNNIQVFIHDQPDTMNLYRKPERFSISLSTLKSRLSKISKEKKLENIAFYPSFSEDWKREPPEWLPIKSIGDLDQHLMITLSPEIAAYSRDIGFMLGKQGDYISRESQVLDMSQPSYSYQKETYLQHVQEVRRLIREQDKCYSVFTRQFADYLNVEEKTVHQWCELVGAIHDLGKLNQKIVNEYWNWQKNIHGDDCYDYLAHTDYDAEDPYQRQKNKKRRITSHAPEGAFAAGPLLEMIIDSSIHDDTLYEQLYRAMELTVKKHHGAFTVNAEPYELVDDAEDIVTQSLKGLGISEIELAVCADVADLTDVNDPVEGHIKPYHNDELIMYWYLSRRLRIADRKSQHLKGGE